MAQNVFSKQNSTYVNTPLYDRELILPTGVKSIALFNEQRGAGRSSEVGASASTRKTSADTNVTSSGGRIGANRMFEATGLCILVEVGKSASTFDPAYPQYTVSAEGIADGQAVDLRHILQSAHVAVQFGKDKSYVEGSALMFPPDVGFASGGGASTALVAQHVGQVYQFGSPIQIDDTVQFGVSLELPAGFEIPSGNIARVMAYFVGTMWTAVQ